MHFCTAKIALSGDLLNVVHRDSFAPVSWPEIEILRTLHGEEAITDIKPFVRIEQSAKDEKHRLAVIYGAEIVEHVFPGRNPQMQLDVEGAKLPDQIPPWRNPLDVDPQGFDRPPEVETKAEAKSGPMKPRNAF